MSQNVDFLLGSASRAIEAINGIVEVKDDAEPIDTNVGSLRSVAVVLQGLASELQQCGGKDCFGRAVDGCKTWVTMDRLSVERTRTSSLEDRLALLEGALRSIAETETFGPEYFAMLVDWREVATRQQSIAQSALNGPPLKRN